MSGKPIADQAGTVVFGRMLAALAEMLLPIVIVRLLDMTAVGVLTFMVVLYGTVTVIVSTNIPASPLYFMPGRDLGQRRALAIQTGLVLVGLGGLASLVLVVCYLIGASVAPDRAVAFEYLPLLACAPPLEMPFRMLPDLLVAESRARASAMASMASSAMEVIAIVVPAALGFGVTGIVLCMVIMSSVKGLTAAVVITFIYRSAPRTRSATSLREQFRYAVPLGLGDIAAAINNRLDRLLIGITLPATVLAEYAAGAWQIPLVTIVPYAVGTVLMPRFVELYKEENGAEVVRLWRWSAEKVALIVVPVAAACAVAAEELVTILFTESYLRGATIFRIYCLLTLGRVVTYGNVVAASGHPKKVLHATLIGFASNVVFSVPLLLLIGFTGPAWGTFLAFFPTVIYYIYWIAKLSGARTIDVFPLRRFALTLLATAIPAGVAIAFKLYSDLSVWYDLLIVLGIVVGGFALVGTVSGLIEREDWVYARRWVSLQVLHDDQPEAD